MLIIKYETSNWLTVAIKIKDKISFIVAKVYFLVLCSVKVVVDTKRLFITGSKTKCSLRITFRKKKKKKAKCIASVFNCWWTVALLRKYTLIILKRVSCIWHKHVVMSTYRFLLSRDDYDKEVKQAKELRRRRHTTTPRRPRRPDLQVYHPRQKRMGYF